MVEVTRRRAVVQVLTALKEPESRPRVSIAKTSDGSITYSVTATGRTVKDAGEKAKATFRDLAAFVTLMRDGELTATLAKGLVEANHR